MTSKEIVLNTLNGKNSGRTARQLWSLPWADIFHRDELLSIIKDYPSDIMCASAPLKEYPKAEKGNMFASGIATDAWGCIFENMQRGIIGEVKQPIVTDDEWKDLSRVTIPEEWLTFDVAEVNLNIDKNYKDMFVFGGCCPRPFEQLQFIRGTENLYVDLMDRPSGFMAFLERMHDFYCRLIKKWTLTKADGLTFMDDWGSQKSLLINPKIWDELFRPMYRDYIDIAHKAYKKVFMHSDGYTLDIIPRLIDIGLDAFNTQIFCMGMEDLRQFKGKITFWGEVDRQNLLPYGSKNDIYNAVKKVYDNLYDGGYCIAQCEFGIGAKPENVCEVFRAWNELTR